MANECVFTIDVEGTSESLMELQSILAYKHPKGLAFFRVFEIGKLSDLIENDNGTVRSSISGICAHSIYSAMMNGPLSYYNLHLIKGEFDNDFKRSNLLRESKRLNLELRINSTEYLNTEINSKSIITLKMVKF